MNHQGTKIIETDRLRLRPFTIDDLEDIYRNCWSEHEVWKWTSYAPMNTQNDVVEKAHMFTDQWLGAYTDPKRYSWAIELTSTHQVIGRIFGMKPDDYLHQVEITYELGSKWWNKGLMTEALKATIRYFFEEIGLNRICAYHAKGNKVSGKVMHKCGMIYEGTLRQGCRCNNGLFDSVCYSILADDYFSV